MLWRIGVDLQFRGPYYHYWIIALLVIFWQVLRQAGAAAAHDAPQELRAAVPQHPADRIADPADPGRARSGGDQEPLPGQRRARHPPAGARAEPVCRLAGQRARAGARDRAQDRRIDQGRQRAVRFAVRPGAARLRQDQAEHRAGRPGQAAARPGAAVPPAGAGEGPAIAGACGAGHGDLRSDPAAAHRRQPGVQRGEVHRSAAACCWPRANDGGGPAHRDLGHRGRHRAGAPARDLPRVLQGAEPRRHRGRFRAGAVHRGAAGGRSWGIRSACPRGRAAGRCSA